MAISALMRAERALAGLSLMKHIWQRHPRCEPIVQPVASPRGPLLPRSLGDGGRNKPPNKPPVAVAFCVAARALDFDAAVLPMKRREIDYAALQVYATTHRCQP